MSTTAHDIDVDHLDVYDSRLSGARTRFANGAALTRLAELEAAPLARFLIHFHARGVRMTEPVHNWISTAADNCAARGLDAFASTLRTHAEAERGHHLWMIDDAYALADRCPEAAMSAADVDALMAAPPLAGGARYIALHETIVSGETPYAQFALQYEMERLPVEHGGALVELFSRRLGLDPAEHLTFLDKHVLLDVGHTQFNRRHLRRLIAHDPSKLDLLVRAGEGILGAYGTFLDGVLDEALAPDGAR